MADFHADIHCHSTCSDGSDEPLALLEKAKGVSLQGLSITDHDSADAYTPEFFALAKALNIRILPGVEFSSELVGIPVHILAYGFDLSSVPFREFLQEIRKSRAERNQEIFRKLEKKNMTFFEEDFSTLRTKTLGRPHIAALMVKKGYVGSIRDAFEYYLKDGASCYAPGFKQTPPEVIDQIRSAGGKAVLAHPHFYKKKSDLKKILSCSFDGIECYYGLLPKQLELPWVKIAKERGWIATGGSDYHGTFKNIPLGSSWVDEETFNTLLSG